MTLDYNRSIFLLFYRLVNILPNSIEKTFASHGDFPIQTLTLSYDATLLATCSHDEYVKFWRTPDVDDIEVGSHQKRRGKKAHHHERKKERQAFFDDL